MFKDSTDITRAAMGIVPVRDENELIEKLGEYKTASVKALRELIRAVNIENQYHILKTAEFNLSKAKDLTCAPFDPDHIISKMDKGHTGGLKEKVATPTSFHKIKPVKKVRKRATYQGVSNDIMTAVKVLRRRGDSDSLGKLHDIKVVAKAKYAESVHALRTMQDEITAITSTDPELYKKAGFTVDSLRSFRKTGSGDVLRLAELTDRYERTVAEYELSKYVMEI